MFDILGITGAALILVAFIFNQRGLWKDTDLKYDVCNLVGGSLLVVSAYLISSYPFLILNTVWTLVSARDILIDLGYLPLRRKRHRRYV